MWSVTTTTSRRVRERQKFSSLRLNTKRVVMLWGDRHVSFLLKGLNSLVEALLHWYELQPQLPQLLVRELVRFGPWLHLI